MIKFWMIIDGQWGSTGKGLIAGYLSREWGPDGVVCNFGPNAGHTFMDDNITVITKQLPTAAVTGPNIKKIFIGPGAVIDIELLVAEINEFSSFLIGKEIYLHSGAAVVLPEHKTIETINLNRISSTLKGTGAALAGKVMRDPHSCIKDADEFLYELLRYSNVKIVNHIEYLKEISSCSKIQIESAQGMELSVGISGFYPYTTGRDITPAQIIADCGLPLKCGPEIIATMRTFPIRVGNSYKDGQQVGWSGPVHSDMQEIFWSDLDVDPERTTVTKKIRRVFTHSDINIQRIKTIIDPDYVFVNFMNYIRDSKNRIDYIKKINQILPIKWLGYGPKQSDIIDVSNINYERSINVI